MGEITLGELLTAVIVTGFMFLVIGLLLGAEIMIRRLRK